MIVKFNLTGHAEHHRLIGWTVFALGSCEWKTMMDMEWWCFLKRTHCGMKRHRILEANCHLEWVPSASPRETNKRQTEFSEFNNVRGQSSAYWYVISERPVDRGKNSVCSRNCKLQHIAEANNLSWTGDISPEPLLIKFEGGTRAAVTLPPAVALFVALRAADTAAAVAAADY